MEVTIVIPGVITVSFLSLFYCCMMPEVGRKDRLEAFEKQYIAHRGFHDNASFNPENTMPAFEKAVENVADQKEAMGIILHADAMDDAQKLRQMLVEKLPEMDIRIYPVGPVIGTHAGPGTIAFCFLGKKREI